LFIMSPTGVCKTRAKNTRCSGNSADMTIISHTIQACLVTPFREDRN
jgi:hypothetical protein